MAFYRVLRTGRVQGALYQAGQIVDLGDDVLASQVSAALGGGLMRLGGPPVAPEPEPEPVAAEPEPVSEPAAVAPEPKPRRARGKRQ